MDSEPESHDVAMDNNESGQTVAAARKTKFLSNGTSEQESPKGHPEQKSLGKVLENGMTCNGMVSADDSHVSGEGADMDEGQKDDSVASESRDTVMRDDDDNYNVSEKPKARKSKSSNDGDGKHNFKDDDVCDSRDDESDQGPHSGMGEDSAGALQNKGKRRHLIKPDDQNISSDLRASKASADISSKNTNSDNDEAVNTTEAKHPDDDGNIKGLTEKHRADVKDDGKPETDSTLGKESFPGVKDEENSKNPEEVQADNDKEKLTSSKNLRSSSKRKSKNVQRYVAAAFTSEVAQAAGKGQKSFAAKPDKGLKENGRNNQARAAGDIQAVSGPKVARPGGSKTAHFGLPGSGAGMSGLNPGSAIPSLATGQGLPLSTPMMHGFMPGFPAHGMSSLPSGFPLPTSGPGPHQGQQNPPIHVPTVAPPKPKSSLDQIELIRWEIQNRINTRPKYFKPNPTSDLGPLAKFLFDIGSDLIKEAVYHDLVKIQSKKNGDNKLNAKEKEDLQKLKEIEKDLFATIGHLKLKLRQKCKVCNFQTESSNVMFHHKQYPHEDNKSLRCAHCQFITKQAVAFKFHMEAEHGVQAKLHDKKAFHECDLCPYENNQEQKLVLHKQRCIKQFRPLFNLHPSCLSGAEINLCLENIFYKPVVPKNLKLLQQKHAQQQAALAEARRQQAQMQALAAQKNAAAVAAKKQQQLQKILPAAPAPRTSTPASGRMPAAPRIPAQSPPVRYNASNTKGPCPTVATMLNTKQNNAPTPPGPGAAGSTPAPGGFEVCEICGGYVKDRKALRIHFFYAHRIDLPFNLFDRTHAPLYCATCYVRFWTAHGLRKHIDTHKEENQTRGVVGKCISCGHHVLNLLLHMRVVHNREMQHYITALMCMFCGNHFSSPQECEQHILKVHGHIDPLTGTLKSAPSGAAPQQPSQKPAPSNKKPGNNNLVKGSVCVLCNLNFGRNVDLTRHCMRMHHTCMKCGMVVIDKASLMKHTCLSSPSGTRDCAMCGETGFHPAYYVKHLRDKHLQKFSIRVSKLSRNTIERWTKRPYPFKDTDVLVEISDDEGNDDSTGSKISPKPAVVAAGKRPRIGPASKIGRPKITPEPMDTPASEEKKVQIKPEKLFTPAADEEKVEIKHDKLFTPAADEEKVELKHETLDASVADGEKVVDEKVAVDTSHSARDDEVTKEETANADDSHDESSQPSPGQKRKLLESPGSDKASKRKK